MSTAPKYVSLDLRSMDKLADLTAAKVSVFQQVANHQHSLMSGWGGCSQARTVYIEATGGASVSQVLSYRVPPGVTHADVSVLLQGRGEIQFQTAVSGVGTSLRGVSDLDDLLENAVWYHTEGVDEDEEGAATAESGRSLKLVSAAAWSHQNVDVTVTLYSNGTDDLQCYAIVFRPVHVPR